MRYVLALFLLIPSWGAPLARFSIEAVNDAAIERPLKPGSAGPAVLRLQVLLDRAHFSSGEIDASYGKNLQSAVAAFRLAHSLPPGESTDKDVWQALDGDTAPVLFTYRLSAEDVNGPFDKIPASMEDKAKLPALSYENSTEKVAEKFHVSPSLLARLNPGKTFDTADVEIVVPNVILPSEPRKAAKVVVNGTSHTVQALDAEDKVLASYPATIGSEHDPLPIGKWAVTAVQHNPVFFYNSDLFWDANEQHAKAKIPAGPNNPVGIVWIGLTKEHYGIHGTPEPGKIGHTESHGCIRLTNWDATDLSHMVGKGTPVIMEE